MTHSPVGMPPPRRRTFEVLRLVWSSVLLLLLFVGLGLVPMWIRAMRYCFNNYDLGIYSQALEHLSLRSWNPWLSGRQILLFADHFDPVIVLGVPFARLFGAPWGGLLTEALVVLGSVGPLILLVAGGVLTPRTGMTLTALLLFNFGTLTAVNFPIHPTTWAVLPWMWLTYALHRRSSVGLLVTALLLFACKEEFPFVGLVLGGSLVVRKQRALGSAVIGLSLGWLAFVFAVRPMLTGATEHYASSLLQGFRDEPLRYLWVRASSGKMWMTLLLLFAPILPVMVYLARSNLRGDWMLLVLLAPPLAIRFLGNAWRHHYVAVIAAGLVGFLMLALRGRQLPGWVVAGVFVALGVTAIPQWRDTFKTFAHGDRFPAYCSNRSGRIDALRSAVANVRARPSGSILVEGNLLPALAGRTDVYMVGGPVPSNVFKVVLVEQPPSGDAWPLGFARVQELIEQWRAAPGVRILRDDEYVFLAEGDLRASW